MSTFESILAIFTLKPIDAWVIPSAALGFYILYRTMSALVFEPYIAFLEKREASSTGAEDTARAMLDKSEQLTQHYEGKLQSERVERMKEKLQVLAEARAKAEKMILEAEEAAHKEITAARDEIKKTEMKNREALEKSASQLAQEIADKIEKPTSAMVS